MKAEVKLNFKPDRPNGPFRPGVWLNESEVPLVIERFPKNSWLRADLIDKFELAKQEAALENRDWAAGRENRSEAPS